MNQLNKNVTDLILEVAELTYDETWSDVQGAAMATAQKIVALVKESSL